MVTAVMERRVERPVAVKRFVAVAVVVAVGRFFQDNGRSVVVIIVSVVVADAVAAEKK